VEARKVAGRALLMAGQLAIVVLAIVVWQEAGSVRELVEPLVVFLNGVPRLVLQPFFIVWLGFGFISRVALVVSVIFVLVTISVSTAMTSIDQDLVLHARVLGASRPALVRQVYLPWLAVDLVGVSRANIGFAFQAALVAEFVGGASGLGYLMVQGQNVFDASAVWAALVVVVVLSVLIDVAMINVQNFVSRWLPSPA
jgi:NitT/TauT family transport system permease protein